MNAIFYITAAVAILSTLLVITRLNAMHALLYLIVSLLAVALMFFTLGAPFAGVLEIIVYAGAIMVLFLFAIMLLNLGPQSVAQESRWLNRRMWVGPAVLALILFVEQMYVFTRMSAPATGLRSIQPVQVGAALFGPYLLAVELASMLLLAGVVGAYHLGRREVTGRQFARETFAVRSAGRETVQSFQVPEEADPTRVQEKVSEGRN